MTLTPQSRSARPRLFGVWPRLGCALALGGAMLLADAAAWAQAQPSGSGANPAAQSAFHRAYELREQGDRAVALEVVRQARQQYPGDARLRVMQGLLEQEITAAQEKANPQNDRAPARMQAGGEGAALPPLEGELVLLDEDALTVLKVYELPQDLRAEKPVLRVPPKVMREVFTKYADRDEVPRGRRDQADFLRRPGYEQVELLFQLKAKEFYSDIVVGTEPDALRLWRTSVHRNYVFRYFSELFGQGSLPLYLFRDNASSEAVAYTNFFILHRYRHDGRKMIDRDNPEESLLLQWGLPRDTAKFPAPDVPGWRPFFRSADDPRFQRQVEWVRSLYPIEPIYGFNYTPPSFKLDE